MIPNTIERWHQVVTGRDLRELDALFARTVDGIEVKGIDTIGWNAAGRTTRSEVAVRPLKAIRKVHEPMGRMLQRLAGRQQAPQ